MDLSLSPTNCPTDTVAILYGTPPSKVDGEIRF
jgi:hypothetical protein